MDVARKSAKRGVKLARNVTSRAKRSAVKLGENFQANLIQGIIVLLLVVYSGVVVNFCPLNYLQFFENIIVKIVFLVVIAFVGLYSPSVALFLAIALIVTIQMAQKKKIMSDLGSLDNTQMNESFVENYHNQMNEEEHQMMPLQNQMQMQAPESEDMQMGMNQTTSDMQNVGPDGYNANQSCIEGCRTGTENDTGNLSNQCSNVVTWDNQVSAQGLGNVGQPGFSPSVGAPF